MRGEFSGVASMIEPPSLWGYSLPAFKKLESPRKTEILLATRVLEQRYSGVIYRCHKEIVVVWQRDCCCVAARLLLCGSEIVVEAPSRSPIQNICVTL